MSVFWAVLRNSQSMVVELHHLCKCMCFIGLNVTPLTSLKQLRMHVRVQEMAMAHSKIECASPKYHAIRLGKRHHDVHNCMRAHGRWRFVLTATMAVAAEAATEAFQRSQQSLNLLIPSKQEFLPASKTPRNKSLMFDKI